MIAVEVSRVLSGDSFETASGDIVRVSGIIAPINGQYLHEESADFLSDLILGRHVRLKFSGKMIVDGMISATVSVKVKSPDHSSWCDIAKRMLIKGLTIMVDDCDSPNLEDVQSIAIEEGRGIWDETAKFNWSK